MITFKGLRLKGLNLGTMSSGVVNIPYSVCKHKYNAVATWSHGTDLYKPNTAGHAYDAEINAFKYNMQMTVWDNFAYGGTIQNYLNNARNSGRIDFGIYFLSWYWSDPFTKEITGIPDYDKTVWSNVSFDKGIIPKELVGKVKKQYYPTIYELYTLTNGKYGINKDTLQIGEIDVVTQVINEHIDWFKINYGYYSAIGGYSQGYDGLKNKLIEEFLAIRGSGWDLNDHNYDMTKEQCKVFKLTSRQNDMQGSMEQIHTQCADSLKQAIATGGWYRDFSHWHWCQGNELQEFFRTQREAIGNQHVITLGFGEAIEYMWLRKCFKSINCNIVNNKVYIKGNFDTQNIAKKCLKSSVSIMINLSSTILANKNVKSNYNILNKNENIYVIDVPYNDTVILEETNTPNYLNFELPTIENIIVNKQEKYIEIITNKETKAVFFNVPLNGNMYEANAFARRVAYSKKHRINISSDSMSNYDLYVGIITKEGQSILSNKFNY